MARQGEKHKAKAQALRKKSFRYFETFKDFQIFPSPATGGDDILKYWYFRLGRTVLEKFELYGKGVSGRGISVGFTRFPRPRSGQKPWHHLRATQPMALLIAIVREAETGYRPGPGGWRDERNDLRCADFSSY